MTSQAAILRGTLLHPDMNLSRSTSASNCQAAAARWAWSAILIALMLLGQSPALAGGVPGTSCNVPPTSCFPHLPCDCDTQPHCPLCITSTQARRSQGSASCCGCCVRRSVPSTPDRETTRTRIPSSDRAVAIPSPRPSVDWTLLAPAIARRGTAPGLATPWLTRDALKHARLCRWTT
jgi:hypothetical protein